MNSKKPNKQSTNKTEVLISYKISINPLNAELNPICHLLALLGAHHIFHISRIRVNSLCTNKNPDTWAQKTHHDSDSLIVSFRHSVREKASPSESTSEEISEYTDLIQLISFFHHWWCSCGTSQDTSCRGTHETSAGSSQPIIWKSIRNSVHVVRRWIRYWNRAHLSESMVYFKYWTCEQN